MTHEHETRHSTAMTHEHETLHNTAMTHEHVTVLPEAREVFLSWVSKLRGAEDRGAVGAEGGEVQYVNVQHN